MEVRELKFEDLLTKPLHEMTDEEIDEVIEQLEPDQLKELEAVVKKQKKKVKPTKKSTTKKSKSMDEFNKALLKGLDDDS